MGSDLEKREKYMKVLEDRYKRKVMAYPEKRIVHFGDCNIFGEAGICTCGLLVDLRFFGHYIDIDEVYPDYYRDVRKHDVNIEILQRHMDRDELNQYHEESKSECPECGKRAFRGGGEEEHDLTSDYQGHDLMEYFNSTMIVCVDCQHKWPLMQ